LTPPGGPRTDGSHTDHQPVGMNRLLYVLLIAGCSLGDACANAAWYEDSQSIMGT
jgi:hypothetical protein